LIILILIDIVSSILHKNYTASTAKSELTDAKLLTYTVLVDTPSINYSRISNMPSFTRLTFKEEMVYMAERIARKQNLMNCWLNLSGQTEVRSTELIWKVNTLNDIRVEVF
jgi:hypothetical protein